MGEEEVNKSITQMGRGRLSRRQFIDRMLAFGVSAPVAARWLAQAGIARAQTSEPPFTPTRRGGGGAVKVLMPGAPTLLTPWLALGWKAPSASRIFYEPLASFGPDGALVPILAREIPSLQNGGVARDGLSVTWKLKPGVLWHDGKPFTADDVVFNWEYAADPATATPRSGTAQELERVERIDAHTVRLAFKRPTPYWATQFCGLGCMLPRHVFEPFRAPSLARRPPISAPSAPGPTGSSISSLATSSAPRSIRT